MNRKEFIEKLIWAGTMIGATGTGLAAATHMTEAHTTQPAEDGQHGKTGDVDRAGHSPQEGQAGTEGPVWRQGKRYVTEWVSELDARPEEVFPLLCPVREYEWLEGWACEMVYSESGVAEENCIFRTHFSGQSATWTVSRYEPPKRIEFVVVTPEVQVCRLNVWLERKDKGTRLRWNRIFTGLSERGNEKIDSWKTASDQALGEKLEYFIKNAKMLRQAS